MHMKRLRSLVFGAAVLPYAIAVALPPATVADNLERWEKYVADYEPDYSGGAYLLEAPPAGRLDTPLPLARNGKAAAEIIVPADADSCLALAGRELALWLGQLTGAEFPVLTEPSGAAVTRLWLQPERLPAGAPDDLAHLSGTDGYAIRTRGSDIYLFGPESKSALNAVYAFLEANSDIIWPRPKKAFEAVYTVNPDLAAVWGDATSRPLSRLRGWGTNYGRNPEDELWMARNRCNYPLGGGGFDPSWTPPRKETGGYSEYGGGHNLFQYIDESYFAAHPEYFALINGERQPPKAMENQLCFTNAAMTREFTRNVRKVLDAAPRDIDCLNIKIEDNWGLCGCPACVKPIALPDGRVLALTDPAFRSTQFFQFLNTVAEAVSQAYPRLAIGTYAYFFTATPPAIPPYPTIRAYFCPYVRNNDKFPIASPVNLEWYERLHAWSRVSPRVTLREYYGVGTNFPRPLAEVAAWDMRQCVIDGVVEFTSEICPDGGWLGKDYGTEEIWDASMLDYWVITRLYWDPTANVEELRRYFLYRSFREAAPAMARYYGTLRQFWYRSDIPSTCGDKPLGSTRNYIIDSGLEAELRGYLDEAAAAARHPQARELVNAHRARFDQWTREAHETQLPSAAIPLRPEAAAEFDHPSWANAVQLEGFRLLGNPAGEPQWQTEVKLQYDVRNLYIFYRCLDDAPEQVHAVRNDTPLERWTEGDHGEIFLADPNDGGNYFQFCFDTRGNRYDLSAREGAGWDGGWAVTTRQGDGCWEAIVTIPLATIGFDTALDRNLTGLFYREYSHGSQTSGEHSTWGGANVGSRAEFGNLEFMR